MLDPELLKLLCCPETHQDLSLAGPDLLKRLNTEISKGDLRNRAGRVVTEELKEALVRADGVVVYAVRNDIPIMLIDEAIALK